MLTIRSRRIIIIVIIALTILMALLPAAWALSAVGWDNWLVVPPFDPD